MQFQFNESFAHCTLAALARTYAIASSAYCRHPFWVHSIHGHGNGQEKMSGRIRKLVGAYGGAASIRGFGGLLIWTNDDCGYNNVIKVAWDMLLSTSHTLASECRNYARWCLYRHVLIFVSAMRKSQNKYFYGTASHLVSLYSNRYTMADLCWLLQFP